MGPFRGARFALVLGLPATLGGCAPQPIDIAGPASAPVYRPAPQPVARAVAPINRDLGSGETLWHVRSALNVAALSCREGSHSQLASNYNRMLKQHHVALASAYAEEEAQYRAMYGKDWQRKQDRHLTQLYNFFASPIGARQFCAAAMTVSMRINDMDADQLRHYSRTALAQLEYPLIYGQQALVGR